jgi:hypothetical protein
MDASLLKNIGYKMLSFIKKLFGSKPAEVKVEEVPYKVEAVNAQPIVEVAAPAVVEPAFPVEAPAKAAKAKKTGATKPATAKKPRKPKAK